MVRGPHKFTKGPPIVIRGPHQVCIGGLRKLSGASKSFHRGPPKVVRGPHKVYMGGLRKWSGGLIKLT